MTDERDALKPLVEQILDLWERTFSRSPLAPGDTLSLRVPGSSDLSETDVARIVEALRAGGYAVSGLSGKGRLSAAGLTVSGTVRLSGEGTLTVSGVSSGTATGTTTWHGSAVGRSSDGPSPDTEVLDDIFQMLALIAEQGQLRGLSPGEAHQSVNPSLRHTADASLQTPLHHADPWTA